MSKKILASLLLMCSLGAAQATPEISVPIPGNLDSRIVTFAYTPDVVFRLPVTVGMHTHIPMGPGEELIETPRIGEKVRWRIEGNEKNLYIKALQPDVRTSLSLVTNKRVYQFELVSTTKSSERIQKAQFTYPDEEAGIKMAWRNRIEETQNEQKAHEQHLNAQNLAPKPIDSSLLSFYSIHTKNEDYKRVHAYSDGLKTWIRLPPGIQDLPAVFMVERDERDKENLMPVNYTVADRANLRDRDVIIIDRFAPYWILRIGKSVEVRLVRD